MHIVTFALGNSEGHLGTLTFRSVDARSVSEVYIKSFDTYVSERHFLMFSSN